MTRKDVFVSSTLVGTFEDISTSLFSYPFQAYMHAVLVNLGVLIIFIVIYLQMVSEMDGKYGWRKRGSEIKKVLQERFRTIDGTTVF